MFENTFNFLTYEAQNIFIYLIIIPLCWTITLDYKLKLRLRLTLLYLLTIIIILQLNSYMYYYNKLINLLQYMSKYGYNYTKTSIVFCILYPLVITIIITLIPNVKKNH